MKFTSEAAIDACREQLLRHGSESVFFADTCVWITALHGNYTNFTIQRMWKYGLNQFTILEAVGSLTATTEDHTAVEAGIHPTRIGYGLVGLFTVVALVAWLSDPRTNCGVILGFVLIIGLLLYDYNNLFDIINELKQLGKPLRR